MPPEEARNPSPPTNRGTAVARVVDALLSDRRSGGWPVSLALTALAVRLKVPSCDLTDHDLADLIAIRAVERGCNIVFDADLLGHS